MLSKNEIEEAKQCLNETIQNTYAEGKAKKLDNLMKYIEQLETREQKLIEKLEEDIKYGKEFESDLEPSIPEIRAEYAQEILLILKGEN